MNDFEKELNDIEQDILRDVHERLLFNTPIKTGNLIRSYKLKKKELYTDVEYATYVELGTEKMSPRLYMNKSLNEVCDE